MTMLNMEEIMKAIGGELISGAPGSFSGVSIDSRTIAGGELFFAIKGEALDGHRFIEKALLKGGGAVVETAPAALPGNRVIIRVKDTLRALQDLAHFMRMRMDVPVAAITGSNGKTTTKEMTYAVLSRRFRTLKNEGNLNNHIGLPLSLMKLSPDDEAIVLEMGMNAAGEIRRLCEIAVPDCGVITNIGTAHIGRLGSREAVLNAKLEIIEGLGAAVVNADDAYLMRGFEKIKNFKGRTIKFAIDNDAHVTAGNLRVTDKGSDFLLCIKDQGCVSVSLAVHGRFNVYNALAAAAVSSWLGMKADEIKDGLEQYRGFRMRFEIIRKKGVTVINDSYNANPTSMEESLKELVRLAAGGRKVAVLGDMGELDAFSEDEHRKIGRMLPDMGIDVFVAVGEKMGLAAEEITRAKKQGAYEVYKFSDASEAGEGIMDILKHGDTVLVKGSRMMSMEKIAGGIADVI